MARRIPRVSIIDIDESDDGSDEQTIRATKLVKASQAYGQSLSNRTATRHASRGIPQDVAVIDVDAEEDLMERHKAELDLEMDGLEFNDIADRKSRSVSVDSSRTVGRDTPPPSDYMRNIGEYDFGKGFVLREDMVVPVKKGFMIAEQQVDFVKVVAMLRDLSTGLVYVQGYVFTRLCNLGGMLDPKLNEVAMLVQEDNSNQVDFQQHRLVKVPLYRIVPRERQLHITNACFPQFRFPVDDLTHLHDQDQAKNWVKENSWLTCRWFFIRRYSNREHMESGGKALESEVRAVSEDDSDDAFKVKDEYKLNDWRGGKIPGGSSLPNGEKVKMILDLDGEDRARNVHIRPGQTYDAGDFFAGAGGVSRGIFDAGARVSLAVDHWAPASASYQANFPTTELRQVDIFDHIIDSETRSHLDLLHLSPPCQVYSPAHTRPGRNDEDNEAALFACSELIKKHRPRVFTLEQTFGILHVGSKLYFNALVQGFTRHGYSVGWTISHFKTYGLPQPRKRLIMFGSCPGEKLPPFPKPTHGDPRRGLRPYVTARDVLSFLRPGMYLHDPRSTVPRDQAPWNPDEPLPWTITCDGGRNTFWDGKRTLTLRELAILQGFARDHKFQEPSIKKQIGNAFPSAVVKVFYAHLVAWLDEQDGIDPARAARQRARVFRDGARSGHRGDGSASSPIELV